MAALNELVFKSMKAKQLFERGMPTEAPPAPVKPTTRPAAPPAPSRPAPSRPQRHPNPYIRPNIRPGVRPAPAKACAEGIKDWFKKKADLAHEIVRPGQSSSYRKFRTKEFFGVEPDPESAKTKKAAPRIESQAKKLFRSL
jgi:hypothetical protein